MPPDDDDPEAFELPDDDPAAPWLRPAECAFHDLNDFLD